MTVSPACFGALALAAAAPALAVESGPGVAVPLPSAALMGLLLLGGIAAFARFPQHKRRRRR